MAAVKRPADPLNPTLEEAAAIIGELANDFRAGEDHYLSASYLEAEVRKDFIDKFLVALGWDVDHNVQKNPFRQEVKVERGVKMAAAQRRADYALSLKPHFDSPLLYVEAKKPRDPLTTPDNYFQIIRYANPRSHAIGVLTTFAELQIIDCRFLANIDTAINRGLKKYRYTDFANQETFSEIFYLLSRPAIASGSIDMYVETLPKPRGRPGQKAFLPIAYKQFDLRLLETLDDLRGLLARALKVANASLDSDALTELTQRILDRLVFIRFLEDKLIEPSPIIPALGDSGISPWVDFRTQCRRLDGIYNGIVFKYHPLLDGPDAVEISDKAIADVLDAFDFHKSHYLFSDIRIDMLGSIYERFLGNVIVATAKRATLEQKPEVRKAGGVYYTPEYIVNYIVKHTVGTLIAGKSPADISKMRFADIACGSGSFLLGAYRYLLGYITTWYNKNPKKAPEGTLEKHEGAFRLSLEAKSQILLDNIFGVDIDPQAVEVAQLSLYLKLLEDETTATARQYTLKLHRTLLPSLSDNIKCGNSLINSRFFDDRPLLDDGTLRQKINPFDWNAEFPDIMKSGGFDAIIGNPPYVNAWELYATVPEVRDYINSGTVFKSADRHWDLYVVFIEKAISLIKSAGRLCYIIPYSYAIQKYGIKSRRMLLESCTIESVLDLRSVRVFGKVPVITMIPVIQKTVAESKHLVHVLKPAPSTASEHEFAEAYDIPQATFAETTEAMLRLDLNTVARALCARVVNRSISVGDICYVNYGAQMSSKIKGKFGKDHVLRDSRESKACKKTIGGRNLYRYRIRWDGKYVDRSLAKQMYGPRDEEFFDT